MKSAALFLALAIPIGFAAPVSATASAEEAPARLTIDTPLEKILADPAGKAVLVAAMPGIDTHPMLDMVKGMSLRQIQPYSEGKITDELLAKVGAALAAIK